MEYVTELRCVNCGTAYPAGPEARTCPQCGPHGILDVEFDYDRLSRRWSPQDVDRSPDPTHWRFMPLIPVDPATPRPGLRHGGTPLYPAPRVAQWLGLGEVWLKDEGQNPSASLKDRASSVGVVKAQEAGARVVACSSTGNAASSLAGCAAAIGMPAVIFVPHYAAQGKVAQLLMFGATVMAIRGSYLQAYSLSQEAIARFGWYNRNAAVNPYLVEGKKTAGLEIAQQLGWEAPDWLAVSVGDGCTIAGIYKGFAELQRLGWIQKTPKLLAVQAEGAPALAGYYRTGVLAEGPETTIADGISVGLPRNPDKAARAVRRSGGEFILVSDEQIMWAMRELGRRTGVFGEPSAAAAIAGLHEAAASGMIGKGQRVVAVVSGNGLKDTKNAIAAAGAPNLVDPDLAAVAAALPPELAP